MFLDTLTSGELNKTGNNTLNNRTGKQVQINEGQQHYLASQKLGGTQTRRDFDDLEQVYRNFANYNDSGLNTMIKTNLASNESSDLMRETQSGEFSTMKSRNKSVSSTGSNAHMNEVVHIIKEG